VLEPGATQADEVAGEARDIAVLKATGFAPQIKPTYDFATRLQTLLMYLQKAMGSGEPIDRLFAVGLMQHGAQLLEAIPAKDQRKAQLSAQAQQILSALGGPAQQPMMEGAGTHQTADMQRPMQPTSPATSFTE
jgi:hypothetical protein